MKTYLHISVLALLLSFTAANAVVVQHIEDSTTRTWFSVDWGPAPSPPLAFLQNGPLSDAGSIDNNTSVHIDAIHPNFIDGFDIVFALGSRLFSTASVNGFAGVQLLPLPGTDYGVEVVYGEPVPQSGGVPDSGQTVTLLACAAGMLFLGLAGNGNAKSGTR